MARDPDANATRKCESNETLFGCARAGAAVDPSDVIAFARARLAHFKCPTAVDVVDALPRTATGKVIKGELREPHWRGHDRRIN